MAILLHWRQISQHQQRHIWEKTQIVIRILKSSNSFFFPTPRFPWSKPLIAKSPRLWVGSLRYFTCVLIWFNKDKTSADLSDMNRQYSVWTVAHVPNCKVLICPRPFYFGRHLLSLKTLQCSVKDRFCWLSFKICLENLLRASVGAIMSSRPTEETKMVPKWLCIGGKQEFMVWWTLEVICGFT